MNNTSIATNDFYLAAYLLSAGNELVDHQRSHHSTFTFEGKELQNKINSFYNDTVKVSAIKFGKAIKQLKGIMYSIKSRKQPNNRYEMNYTYQ